MNADSELADAKLDGGEIIVPLAAQIAQSLIEVRKRLFFYK